MEYLDFSWWDYALFFIMVGFSTTTGIYHGCFGTKQSSATEYLYGGSRMKVLPVSMSLVASTISGISLLGIPAEIYMYGTQFWVMVFSVVLVGLAINVIYLPVFHNLKLQSTYGYLEMRYDKNVRRIASFLYVIRNVLYMAIVIYVPSLALNQVTGFDLHLIAISLSCICIFYTSIGGLKTVVWVDTLQFSVTLFTLAFVLVMGAVSVGGFSHIWNTSERGDRIEFFNLSIDPTIRVTFWSVLVGQTFSWAACTGIDSVAIQRLLAVPTINDSKKILIIFVLVTVATKSINCFSGLIVFTKYFNCDPLTAGFIRRADQILPHYVLDVAHQIPGLSGLFIAGLFSTSLSALSASLNVLSGVVYTDFVEPLVQGRISEQKASIVMKAITVVIGVVCVGLVFVVEKLGSVLELSFSLGGITSGPLLGLFTMGMLFPFVNTKGAICGGLGSLVLMSWIVINAQILIWNGSIMYHPKPLRTVGCNSTLLTGNITNISTDVTYREHEPALGLAQISFHYYPFIGFTTTLLIGCAVSWITRTKDSLTNSDLLSPIVHKFLPSNVENARYESVEKAASILHQEDEKTVTKSDLT